MQDQNSKPANADESSEKLAERREEATSDETLSDLEETETDAGPSDTQLGPGPSPDGLLDEPDEIKDAGPM
jgi:hypothetical protein